MQLPEFKAAYLEARREVVFQTNARLQQNAGAAASVLFKLMADPATPPSIRARTAQCILECANKSLALENMEMRILTDGAGTPGAEGRRFCRRARTTRRSGHLRHIRGLRASGADDIACLASCPLARRVLRVGHSIGAQVGNFS